MKLLIMKYTDATVGVIENAREISKCTRYVLGNNLQVKSI
jgi:hypothetical protein